MGWKMRAGITTTIAVMATSGIANYMPATMPVVQINGSVALHMRLPACFGDYAEIFGRSNLLTGNWEVVDGWIPTYGLEELLWLDVVRSNTLSYFFMVCDATLDLDGDGFSDHREHFISQTDPCLFNNVDSDSDGMHDWWEIKLFGNLSEDRFSDYDGDLLLNGEELTWLPGNLIVMHSDPSLFDTDGEGLDDYQERQVWNTEPMHPDTDSDGKNDAFEVLGSLRTDPHNPDIISPVLTLTVG